MKKIITIMAILCMVIMTVPAMADWDQCVDEPQITTINTHTTVLGTTIPGGTTQGGSENLPPYIKVKWEYDEEAAEHDSCIDLGLQVAPELFGTRTVGYYAVVTDPNGRETVANVYADVYHPDGSYKYQVELYKIEDKLVALDIWDHAYGVHSDLITVNEEWAFGLPPEVTWAEDVRDELNEQLAYLYYGEAEISYCQPGGWYYVGVRAHDVLNMWSDYLCNRFWYIPTSAVEIDFDAVDYSQEGPVAVSYERWIGGDYIMRGAGLENSLITDGRAWVLENPVPAAPLYREAGQTTEEQTLGLEGCPVLVAAASVELGIPGDTIEVTMANSYALNTDIQPCETCARLVNAAAILRDEDGSVMAAMNQVFNELAPANVAYTPEVAASIVTAFAGRVNDGTQYATVIEFIDALVQYIAVLDNEMGSPVGDSVAYVIEKYGKGITESENNNMAAFIAARLESGATFAQ